MSRRKRCIPAERGPVHLTERDYLLLDAVARCGYLTSAQITREFFKSQDRALHRLRQLVDARYLNATLLASRAPNLLSCTSAALDALRDRDGSLDGIRLPSPIRASAVPHFVLTNDFRLYCAALREAGHGELLRWDAGAGVESQNTRAHRLRPDATISVRLGSAVGTAFVEIDCGHEGADLEDKLSRYARLLPVPATQVWIVAAGPVARVLAVARMCRRHQIDRFCRLFTPEDICVRPAKPAAPRLFRLFEP